MDLYEISYDSQICLPRSAVMISVRFLDDSCVSYTPQGGVPSYLILNVAINILLYIMEGYKIFTYADDVAIEFTRRFPQTRHNCIIT